VPPEHVALFQSLTSDPLPSAALFANTYTIADGESVPYNDCLRERREAEGAVQ
jgi:hypothetical protein